MRSLLITTTAILVLILLPPVSGAATEPRGLAIPCALANIKVNIITQKEADAERKLAQALQPGAAPANVAELQNAIALWKYRLTQAQKALKHCHK